MFKKLDWYILRQFVVAFVFCMLLFTVIAVAVDSSEKTDDFVKSGLSTSQIIKLYYVGFVPYIWGLLYPLFVFIAVIFFTSRMALRSEIIAILACGTTYNRWLSTYIFGGVFFAILLWFAARYMIPKANEIRGTFQVTYLDAGDRTGIGSAAYYMRADTNTYVGLKYFDTTTKTASTVFLNRLQNGELAYNLRAQSMTWDGKQKKWKLSQVVERKVSRMKEETRHLPEMYMDLNFGPEALKRDYYIKDRLTTPELNRLIAGEELRGNENVKTLKVEKYRRSATPFSVLLLTVIGAIVAGRKSRGGSGLHLAIGIIIAAVFILLDRFSTVFSTKGDLPPIIAAWIPNIIFTIVAVYLYRKAPK